MEGQRQISAAEMSEESVLPFDPPNRRTQGKLAQDDIVFDEFLREEIGCCPENIFLFFAFVWYDFHL
jgi:alpha-glucuronidase